MKAETIKEAYKLLRVAEYLDSFAERLKGDTFLTNPYPQRPVDGPTSFSCTREDASYIRRALKAGVAELTAAAKALGVEE